MWQQLDDISPRAATVERERVEGEVRAAALVREHTAREWADKV